MNVILISISRIFELGIMGSGPLVKRFFLRLFQKLFLAKMTETHKKLNCKIFALEEKVIKLCIVLTQSNYAL